MKSQIKQSTTVLLELTPVESNWLKAQMQNPLHYEHPSDEPEADRYMRSNLFNALEWCENVQPT